MKTVLILRHAKSSWSESGLPDHDRPLNKRGRKAAPRMGCLLADEDLVPELIFCSTARRARETASLVAEACGYEGEIEFREDLYHAAPAAYLDALSGVSDALERVLVVGHNPGLERLVGQMSGRYERFPTAALARVDLDVDSWSKIHAATGTLAGFWLPRELD